MPATSAYVAIPRAHGSRDVTTPTDGSTMVSSHDGNGVECDTCHRMTNPDQSEHLGVQNYPFIANNERSPAIGYYGSAQYVMWPEPGKLGPYLNSVTKHPLLQSKFHRSPDFCGTCHNALPVPYCQFGCPSNSGTYQYYDWVGQCLRSNTPAKA